jgi:hypothetical protein
MNILAQYGRETAQVIGGIVLLMLSGCLGPDKAELAELIPLEAGTFEYRVLTNLFQSAAADSGDERMRLIWLAADMRSSQICGDRYELVSRRIVFQYQAPDGHPVDQIVYRGRCRV